MSYAGCGLYLGWTSNAPVRRSPTKLSWVTSSWGSWLRQLPFRFNDFGNDPFDRLFFEPATRHDNLAKAHPCCLLVVEDDVDLIVSQETRLNQIAPNPLG
jgi:hypothetical protein